MKKILLIILLFNIQFITVYGNYSGIDKKTSYLYEQLSRKITSQNSLAGSIQVLKRVQGKLQKFQATKITSKNKEKISDILHLNSEKIAKLTNQLEKKQIGKIFSKNSLLQKFKHPLYNNNFFVLEDGVWHYYSVRKYIYVEEKDIRRINERFLQVNNISYDTPIFYIKNGIGFASEYQKYRLISDDILFGVPNKNYILKLIAKYQERDNKNENLDGPFKLLKATSKHLTKKDLSKDEKISTIYNYILENIDYKLDYSLSNAGDFSGIKTFITKTGVCEGYVEMMIFMLAFVDIDSQLVGGEVITAKDFGQIGHAWIKIGNYYYDPTFDDPVGGGNLKKEDYKYYKIPRDLFYTNRFDLGNTPKNLYGTSLEMRKNIVQKNLASLYPNYKNTNYNLLKEFRFRDKYGFGLYSPLKMEDFTKMVKASYNTDDIRYVYINGQKTPFKKINYYIIKNTNEDIKNFIEHVNYDLHDYIFIEVEKNGNTDFVLSNSYSFY